MSDLRIPVLDQHPTATICVALDGNVTYANRNAVRLLGQTDTLVGANIFNMFHEPEEKVAEIIHAAAASSIWQPLELTMSSGSHEGVRLALRCRGMRDPESGVITAVLTSDENRKPTFEEHRKLIRKLNAELREQHFIRKKLDAALENETRLHQELIHRVKNNLSLLSSLIRVRAAAAENEEVKSALEDVQARVMSIGLVHELLDQNKQIDVVDSEQLLERLCVQMESSVCPPGVTIKRNFTPYKLHVSEATPLALLINELVTNSLKHAFSDRATGEVDIALKRNGVDKIEVHVADNGAGFLNATGGHGSRIVEALAQQLNAEMSVTSDQGTSWQLIFAPTGLNASAPHH